MEAALVESEVSSIANKNESSSEIVSLREQLGRTQDAYRKASIEQEKLKEELQRRSDLLEKKDSSYQAQLRKIEAAEARIRELVHSEGEAAYKSRAIAGKLANLEKELATSENSRKALEKKFQNSQLQVNELSGQIQSQGERLKQMLSASDRKSQSTGELEQQNRDLEAKLARATSNLGLFQGKLQSLQRQISDRETELELTQQKEKLAQKEREVVQKELEETRRQVKSYRDALTGLEQALVSHKQQLSDLENALEHKKLEQNKAELTVQQKEQELIELKSDIERLDKDLKSEQLEKAELLEHIDQLESDLIDEANEKNKLLQAKDLELAALGEKVSSHQKSSASERASYEALAKTHQALKADLEERTSQIKELKAFADRIKPAYETLKEHFTELQAQNKSQASQIDSLNKQLTAAKSSNQDLDSSKQELVDKLALTAQERERLEQETIDLKAEKSRLEAELSRLEELRSGDLEALEELDSELQKHSDLLADATSSKLELEKLIEAKAQENEAIQKELSTKSQDLSSLKQDYLKLEEELKSTQLANLKAQTNLKELLKQRNQLVEHKKQLDAVISAGGEAQAQAREQLQNLDADRETLQTALEELQKEFEDAQSEWERRLSQHQLALAEQESNYEKEITSLKNTKTAELEEAERLLLETKEALEAKLAEEKNGLEISKSQLVELESSLREARVAFEALTIERDKERQEAKNIESQKEEALNRLEEESTLLKNELKKLSSESVGLKTKISTLELDLQKQRLYSASEGKAHQAAEQNLNIERQQVGTLKTQLEQSQRERLALRDVIDKLQKVSKERLEAAKTALNTRETQLIRLRDALTAKEGELSQTQSKLERAYALDKALRGAIDDLRHMLTTKEEMIEELEWHLGLVYETVEGLQEDLDSHTEQSAKDEEQHNKDIESFMGQISELEEIQIELATELDSLKSSYQEQAEELVLAQHQLADSNDKLQRQTERYEGVQAELNSEYEYSANLSDQLSQALSDRNKASIRLLAFQEKLHVIRDRLSEETPVAMRPLGLEDVDAIREMMDRHIAAIADSSPISVGQETLSPTVHSSPKDIGQAPAKDNTEEIATPQTEAQAERPKVVVEASTESLVDGAENIPADFHREPNSSDTEVIGSEELEKVEAEAYPTIEDFPAVPEVIAADLTAEPNPSQEDTL